MPSSTFCLHYLVENVGIVGFLSNVCYIKNLDSEIVGFSFCVLLITCVSFIHYNFFFHSTTIYRIPIIYHIFCNMLLK